MNMTQAYGVANALYQMATGQTDPANINAAGLVDAGATIVGSKNIDNYCKALIDQINLKVIVDRPYTLRTPSLVQYDTEYGIMEKIRMKKAPTAIKNDSWDLQDGQAVPRITTLPQNIEAKFFSDVATWDVRMTFGERQVRSAFSSPVELLRFFNAIESMIYRGQICRISETAGIALAAAAGYALTATGTAQNINLLTMYNAATGETLSQAAALNSPEFLRFASMQMALYPRRMENNSVLFNAGGNETFTPPEYLHIVLLDEFAQRARTYLYSDTFHDEFVRLPDAETVAFWQGSGSDFSLVNCAQINVTLPDSAATMVNQAYVLGMMFDRDAVGVTVNNRRVTSEWIAANETYTNYYKVDIGHYVDPGENFVVFHL